MASKNQMELVDMEIDELSLSSVHGGFGWFPAKKGRPSFGSGAPASRPINIEFNFTVIKIEGNMNIAGGQDVTLPG